MPSLIYDAIERFNKCDSADPTDKSCYTRLKDDLYVTTPIEACALRPHIQNYEYNSHFIDNCDDNSTCKRDKSKTTLQRRIFDETIVSTHVPHGDDWKWGGDGIIIGDDRMSRLNIDKDMIVPKYKRMWKTQDKNKTIFGVNLKTDRRENYDLQPGRLMQYIRKDCQSATHSIGKHGNTNNEKNISHIAGLMLRSTEDAWKVA